MNNKIKNNKKKFKKVVVMGVSIMMLVTTTGCQNKKDMINVKDTNQVERYVPILKSEVDRLLSLLQDFLSINKIKYHIWCFSVNVIEDFKHIYTIFS